MFNFLVIVALIGLLPAAIAQSKGRSFLLWWIYGAAIFIVALPHALMMSKESGNGRVKCPNCAELILEQAKVCRFCGRDVGQPTAAPVIAVAPERAEVTVQPAIEESAAVPETRPRITIEEGPSAFGELPQAPGGFGSMTTTIVITAIATIAALIAFGASGCPQGKTGQSTRPKASAMDSIGAQGAPSISGLSERESADLISSARKIVTAMVETDALRDINGPYSVVVGPAFSTLPFETKRSVCQGVSVLRAKSGNTADFFLKDPTSREKFGEFINGKLVLD